MPGVMVFAEKDEIALELAVKGAELARQLNTDASAVIQGSPSKFYGERGPAAGSRASSYFNKGIARVYFSDRELLKDPDSKIVAEALFQIAGYCQPDIILLASTRRGKEIAARLAQMWCAACVTNALSIDVKEGKVITSRYGLGGKTVISECLESPKKVIALIPQTFESIKVQPADGQVIEVNLKVNQPERVIVERIERGKETVDIEKAPVLVSVGCGLKSKEDLILIRELAGALKGEIGCTKQLASNRGWLSEDRIIGISGKRCKPRLAFCIGVSGQSQHLGGLMGTRVIVAVNNDKSAPIFKAADYGIVGDLYRVVPALTKRLTGR